VYISLRLSHTTEHVSPKTHSHFQWNLTDSGHITDFQDSSFIGTVKLTLELDLCLGQEIYHIQDRTRTIQIFISPTLVFFSSMNQGARNRPVPFRPGNTGQIQLKKVTISGISCPSFKDLCTKYVFHSHTISGYHNYRIPTLAVPFWKLLGKILDFK